MKQIVWIGCFLMMLGFASLACSPDDEASMPPTVADVAVVPEQVENGTQGSGNSGSANNNSGGDTGVVPQANTDSIAFSTDYNFDSYLYSLVVEFSDADTNQRMEMNVAATNSPDAQSATISAEGIDEVAGINSLSFVRVGNTSYMIAPGLGCIVNEASEDLDLDLSLDLSDPAQFIDRLLNANLVGVETINGVPTNHYRFDETLFQSDGELEEAEGHIYIAEAGRYVVRFTIEGRGDLGFLDSEAASSQGDFKIAYDLLSINSPEIEVIVPSECEEQL